MWVTRYALVTSNMALNFRTSEDIHVWQSESVEGQFHVFRV